MTATNSDDVAAVGISAGGAGTVAVQVSGSIDVFTVITSAGIGESAEINCAITCASNVSGANAAQSVHVVAANAFYELGIAGTIAIAGTAGVAVPVGVRVVNLTTDAFIGATTQVNARDDVVVSATGKDTIVSVVVGAGGGTVGVAGSVSVAVLNVHTYATTGDSVTIVAGGDVLVAASDDTKLVLLQIAIAGGYVGVGAAVGVAPVDKDVQAFVGSGSAVDAKGFGSGLHSILDGEYAGSGFSTFGEFHGLAVQATSSEDLFGLSASVAGGFVGVAGGVGVNLLGVTVKALVGANAHVNELSGANAVQSVAVAAADKAKTLTIAGGAAGGFVGVAGGVDIGVLDVSVQAAIGTNAVVHALDDVLVAALSIKDVTTLALSIGGGFVGIAGSVSVWTVGTQATTTYEGSGSDAPAPAWDSGKADYRMGDVVTFGGQRYGAKVDNPTAGQSPVANPTQWEGQKTPLKSGSQGQQRGTWTSGTAYDKDDVVTFNGKQYTAVEDNPNTTLNPEVNVDSDPNAGTPFGWTPVRDAGDEADSSPRAAAPTASRTASPARPSPTAARGRARRRTPRTTS